VTIPDAKQTAQENVEAIDKALKLDPQLTFRSYKINFPNKAGGLKIFETYL